MDAAVFRAALFLTLGLLGVAPLTAHAATIQDRTPRIAVMSAFAPELTLLEGQLAHPSKRVVDGVTFTTGTLRGKPVVLFLSGVSMTNAAMNTQRVLDRFSIRGMLFSGIAGGVNPALHIGDVAVATRWGQYLEVLMAREAEPGRYTPPPGMSGLMPNFGMMFPRAVQVRSRAHPAIEQKFWFDVDPKMLAVARTLQATGLSRCDAAAHCLNTQPKVVVGGNGVSGQAFVDNAGLRDYAFKTFQANVLDMESAACAMVAYSNGVPFIAFRSLSDLAGGSAGPNEMHAFMDIAAENSARVLLAFLSAWK